MDTTENTKSLSPSSRLVAYLKSVREVLEETRSVYLVCPAVETEQTDDLVDLAIELDAFDKFLKTLQSSSGTIQGKVEKTVVDRFIELGQDSVKRNGKTVFLARENWPAPIFTDLLPEGVNPEQENDEKYETTFAGCRQAGKDRLLNRLKSSPKFAYLVSENYNMQSLRSALAGKDAERDELDQPVVPGELADVVQLKPQTVLRIRKS